MIDSESKDGIFDSPESDAPAEPVERVLLTDEYPRIHWHAMATKRYGTWVVQVVARIIVQSKLPAFLDDILALANNISQLSGEHKFKVKAETPELIYEGQGEMTSSRTLDRAGLDKLIETCSKRAWEYVFESYRKDHPECT